MVYSNILPRITIKGIDIVWNMILFSFVFWISLLFFLFPFFVERNENLEEREKKKSVKRKDLKIIHSLIFSLKIPFFSYERRIKKIPRLWINKNKSQSCYLDGLFQYLTTRNDKRNRYRMEYVYIYGKVYTQHRSSRGYNYFLAQCVKETGSK